MKLIVSSVVVDVDDNLHFWLLMNVDFREGMNEVHDWKVSSINIMDRECCIFCYLL